jgi:hypothetical protein
MNPTKQTRPTRPITLTLLAGLLLLGAAGCQITTEDGTDAPQPAQQQQQTSQNGGGLIDRRRRICR